MVTDFPKVILGEAENIRWFRDCFWADLPVMHSESKRRLLTIRMRYENGGDSYLVGPRLWITPPLEYRFSGDVEFVSAIEKVLNECLLEWDKENQAELQQFNSRV